MDTQDMARETLGGPPSDTGETPSPPPSQDRSWFSSLSLPVQTSLRTNGHDRAYRRGEQVIQQGQAGASLLIVQKGCFRRYHLAVSGEFVILDLIGPGWPLNLASVLDGARHTLFIESVSPGRCLGVPADRFLRLLADRSELQSSVSRTLAMQICRQEERHACLCECNAMQRVARFLCCNAPPSASPVLTLPALQTDIASFLDLRPETLSRMLRQLVAVGAIECAGRRRWRVCSRGKLHEASGCSRGACSGPCSRPFATVVPS